MHRNRSSFGSVAIASIALFAQSFAPVAAQSASPAVSPRASVAPLPACTATASPTTSPSEMPAGSPAASPAVEPTVAASTEPETPGSPTAGAGELTVFAAASLKGVFESIVPTVIGETGIAPVYSFGSSSALRTQIEQGAPADVFASADTSNVQALVDGSLAQDAVVFACNELTIIVPADNPAGIASAADLGRPGVKVIAAGPDVPITRYATQLVTNLGIADAYSDNVVSQEDNVAAVRTKIETGEGDAAIVYVTDAQASGDSLQQVPVPAEANVPATYAAAVVADTDQPDESAAFLSFLTGPEGQSALASFGFLPAPAH